MQEQERAKVAVFDDFKPYVEMAAAPLKMAGHRVLEMVMEDGAIDWEAVMRFGPDVISVALYRKRRAFNRPIRNWEEDVLGYKPIKEMEAYPAINVIPIVLVGSCLEDFDVPTHLNYDLFLSLPEDIRHYVSKIEEVARTVKSRRQISGYACPVCQARLLFIKQPVKDLFCPRCHTAVAIVDDETILYSPHGEAETQRGSIDQLAPVARPVDAP